MAGGISKPNLQGLGNAYLIFGFFFADPDQCESHRVMTTRSINELLIR